MLSLALLLCVSLFGVAQCNPLEVTVSTSDWYRLGEEIECKVIISNTLGQDLLLFHRNTPFEGFKSDIFVMNHEQKKVKYDAALFKRAGVDTKEETTLVRGKSSVEVKVDLSLAYGIKQAGFYSVQLSSDVYYQIKASSITRQRLSSPPASFEVLPGETAQQRMTIGERVRLTRVNYEISKELSPSAGVKDPKFYGNGSTDSVEQNTAKTAWEGAYDIIMSSPKLVDEAGEQYTKWFGAKDEGRQDTVKGIFERVQKAMEEQEFTLYFHGPECERDTFAYTYPDDVYIYLCMSYFRARDTHDINSKLGTFVHQLSINVADTKDFTRIESLEECQNLAIDQPDMAIRSAFNYEYFCETQ